LERFRCELREVTGATVFIQHFAHIPRSIASSSSINRLRLCLDVLGLKEDFGAHVYSGDTVKRGKPHPDLFLMASDRMGIAPSHGIVIEDSVGGVRAGIAAGTTVIGLCAASQVRTGHAERLQAGAPVNAILVGERKIQNSDDACLTVRNSWWLTRFKSPSRFPPAPNYKVSDQNGDWKK